MYFLYDILRINFFGLFLREVKVFLLIKTLNTFFTEFVRVRDQAGFRLFVKLI